MWSAPPPDLALHGGELHVWRADLARSPDRPELLSPAERERAARFRFERDRAAYSRSHAALRVILARYTGIPAAALLIGTAPHGKPFLDPSHGSEAQFSLSHSSGLALLAVALAVEVGADIECADGRRRPAGFLRRWVRREAYGKATGEGLRAAAAPPAAGWRIYDLEAGPHCAAAVAIHAADARLLTWEYPAT